VVKVCGNPKTYARMSGDMDINAGRIMTGEAGIAEVGREILDCIVDVAAGKPRKSEALGHREYCVPYKVQELCANV
jgi:altronate hydrolase